MNWFCLVFCFVLFLESLSLYGRKFINLYEEVILMNTMSANVLLTQLAMESADILFLQNIEAETKWPTFCRQHFQMHFL